jgi:hypothetical protein
MSVETLNNSEQAGAEYTQWREEQAQKLAVIATEYAQAHSHTTDPNTVGRYASWLRSPDLWD